VHCFLFWSVDTTRRFVTFYISALEILLLTYLLTYTHTHRHTYRHTYRAEKLPSWTSGDELSPSDTIAGSISRVTSVYIHRLQIFFQRILPCPHWSSNPPPATFWDPFQSQTSWSGCRELQNVPNKSSPSGRYYVVQCQLSRSCYHFVICNVVSPWNAQNAPETSTMENVNHLGNSSVCFPRFTDINPCWNYNGRVQT